VSGNAIEFSENLRRSTRRPRTGSEDAATGLQELIDLAPTQSREEYLDLRDQLLQRLADAAALLLESG
jgi:hypothetical protein